MSRLYLILENGKVFEGESFGAEGETVGELVFTTGMAGYAETLSDPCNYGQIVCQTYPIIGAYGISSADLESPKPSLKAYIVREWCKEPSNFRSEGDLFTFLMSKNIIGLCGIDTRELTRIIRENGVMNAKISKTPTCDLEELKNYRVEGGVKATTCHEKTFAVARNGKKYSVAVLDLGAKHKLVSELTARNCDVYLFPASSSAEEIISSDPDGIIISDGAGDPAENTEIIAEVKKLLDSGIPVFGISLGHQLIALAGGAKTFKLKYGHRGGNHPVKNALTGKMSITTQNHGYAVCAESLPEGMTAEFYNLNDKTCEGLSFGDKKAFSVQFVPETTPGPNSTGYIYDRFIEMIKKEGNE